MSTEFDWSAHITELGALPPLTQLWEQEMVEELGRWIPRDRELHVLEIGCSNGRWLRWFQQEFHAQTYGVDLNPAGFSGSGNFGIADGLGLPFPEGSFDVVFSLGLVEHFANRGLRRRLLAEHVRVAKLHSGIVWVEHPNLNPSLDWLYVKYQYDHRLGYRHFTITDRETKDHLTRSGVEILCTRWLGWVVPSCYRLVSAKIHKHLSWFPLPEKLGERRRFVHSLTADNLFVIGYRR